MSDAQQTPTADEQDARDDEGLAARLWAAVVTPSTLTSVLAVVAALMLGAVLVAASDEDTVAALGYVTARPSDFLTFAWDASSSAYVALFQGAVGSWNAVSETLLEAAPLILAGLAVAVPFRAGLFNIGGEGQVIAGGLVGGFVGFAVDGLPLIVHLPLALTAGLLAGAAMGAIPGVLKARTGAHEVITTIMLNNIASPLLFAVLVTDLFQQPGRNEPISKLLDEDALLPSPSGVRVDATIIVALLAAAAVWYLMSRSTLGFQIKAVGANASAAETAGMRAASITVATFAIAGALAGLAGAGIVLSSSNGQGAITSSFSAGVGFDGITVALLGRGRAGGTVGAGLLFGALSAGGLRMQAVTGTPVDLVQVIQALVILFVAAPLAIRALFRIRSAAGSVGTSVAKGWGA